MRAAIASLGNYRYEHIFIDNASEDNTVGVLKAIAAVDRNVKVIRNTRNFGHIRSPMHALHQATGRCRDRHRRRPAGSAGDDTSTWWRHWEAGSAGRDRGEKPPATKTA